MRSTLTVFSLSIVLAACQSADVATHKENLQVISTLDPVNFAEEKSFVSQKMDQYKISGMSLGSWVNQKPGQYFKLVNPQYEKAAVLYLYRADSKWNRQEIIAPSFFLNGKRIPSLISNHYYWVELAEGDYQLSLSRPLAVLHFQKPLKVNFKVKAGEQYFLKYEEEQFRGGPNGDADLLRVGPLMQMPTRQALKEIGMTQLKTPGLNYVAQVLPNGNLKKTKKIIKGEDFKASDNIHLKEPFKLYDPRTW